MFDGLKTFTRKEHPYAFVMDDDIDLYKIAFTRLTHTETESFSFLPIKIENIFFKVIRN